MTNCNPHNEILPSSRHVRKEREQLYDQIFPVMAEKGIKSCTMDLVASELGMSKRTLYELFTSKDEMLVEILTYFMEKGERAVREIFNSSANVMEAMTRHAFLVQEQMEAFSPAFFHDLTRYPFMRHHIESRREKVHGDLCELMERGMNEGVFRSDVNYDVTLRLVHLQHEALARITDLFPPEVTLAQAHEAITIGFLRSIASPKGMKILDGLTEARNKVDIDK